jgi:hypothetical protein
MKYNKSKLKFKDLHNICHNFEFRCKNIYGEMGSESKVLNIETKSLGVKLNI